MPSTVRQGEFYPVWPIIDGKPLQLQWGEERRNTSETKAIVRNSFQDIEDGVDILNAIRAHIGQAFGDVDFETKYRFIYNKVTEEFCVQRNKGTVAVPNWIDTWCIRFSDGRFEVVSDGGLYSPNGFYPSSALPHDMLEIAETNVLVPKTFSFPDKLFFNEEHGFFLTEKNAHPVVNFAFPFGRSQTFTRQGRQWIVNHNFNTTPVMVQVMNDGDEIVIPDKVDVSDPNTTYFYFRGVFSGKALIATGGTGAADLRPRDPFYMIVRTQDVSRQDHRLDPSADLTFEKDDFYVRVDETKPNPRAFVKIRRWDSGSPLRVREVDGTPDVLPVNDIIVTNGTLTDNTGGSITLDVGGGSSPRHNTVTARGFYVMSGGEFSQKGIVAPKGEIEDDFVVGDRVVAAGFYVSEGGELSNEGLVVSDGRVKENLIAGNPGSEGGGFGIGGTTITSPFKVSNLGATNVADLHVHRHSSTTPAAMFTSRSQSDDESHTDVADNQPIFRLWASAWNTSTYEVSSRIDMDVDGEPSAGNTPGKIMFRNTKRGVDSGVTPPVAMTIHNDAHVSMENTLQVENAVTAEGFYVSSGGQLSTVGLKTKSGDFSRRVMAEGFYLNSGLDLSRVRAAVSLEAPARHETITWFIADRPMNARRLRGFLRAKDSGFYPGIDFTVRHGSLPARGTGTELTTGGYSIGFYPNNPTRPSNSNDVRKFDNPAITKDDYVWLEVTDLAEGGGNEEELHVNLELEAR
jgi:hypothetical protein